MKPSWIQCNRQTASTKSGGPSAMLAVRIRADFVTAVMESWVKVGDKGKLIIRLQLGNNNHVDVVDETLESVYNKICVAIGSGMPVVTQTSPDYPGHPDYGKREAA